MGVKLAALYLLPYVVIGAHEVAATVNVALSDRSAKSAIISEQVVNRSLKRDRLPIRQVTPGPDVREYFKVPARLAPNQKNDTDCNLQLTCVAGVPLKTDLIRSAKLVGDVRY